MSRNNFGLSPVFVVLLLQLHYLLLRYKFLENFFDIKDGQAYILLTVDEGIVFKIIYNRLKKKKCLELHSLNPAYAPYEVQANEIKEVWKFCNYISSELPGNFWEKDKLITRLERMEMEMKEIKQELR